ncbi:MAG: hypothetical protein ABL901_10115 [Hyphomicrobiaceae bacterium]
MAEFIELHAREEIVRACEDWHSNEGYGLDEENSLELADELKALLDKGRVEAYVIERKARLAALPNIPCDLCHGSGIRSDKVGREFAMPETVITTESHPRHGQKGWCNGCDGRGSIRPSPCSYRLDVDDVQDFVGFLLDCGGFEIC